VVIGGERRRDSVRAGLEALPDCEYVIVHDGARPLVEAPLIDAVLDAARESGAAICAIPVSDTVKLSNPPAFVQATVDRNNLWLAQTPQAFRREILLRAHDTFDLDATDDAALVERLDEPVRIVPGSRRNIKVTSPEDLAFAAALLSSEQG
jgi:2-C-methyl-D-erythritol 4-phosphate cytidylyltransferase